jgi:hypothetical protein
MDPKGHFGYLFERGTLNKMDPKGECFFERVTRHKMCPQSGSGHFCERATLNKLDPKGVSVTFWTWNPQPNEPQKWFWDFSTWNPKHNRPKRWLWYFFERTTLNKMNPDSYSGDSVKRQTLNKMDRTIVLVILTWNAKRYATKSNSGYFFERATLNKMGTGLCGDLFNVRPTTK